MKTVLELEFLDQIGKSFKIRVTDPKPDLEGIDIQQCMDIIITNNIFVSNNTNLVSMAGARVIKTTIEEYEVEE